MSKEPFWLTTPFRMSTVFVADDVPTFPLEMTFPNFVSTLVAVEPTFESSFLSENSRR